MPLSRIQKFEDGSILGLWRISETVDDLIPLAILTHDELEQLYKFKSATRQLHWLAWRALIHRIAPSSPFSLIYDNNGKPFPNDYSFQLSVSHSGNWASCLINPTHPVGLDIEAIQERVLKVKERFLSSEELEYFLSLGNDPLIFTILWSTKEAVFKYIGRKGIDIRQQIKIEPFSPLVSHTFYVNIRDNSNHNRLMLNWENIDDKYLIVYTR
jgi:phosphopantetheinyl transferase